MIEFSNAIHDLRYLLDRGYPRESAVGFVSNHYRLSLDQRHLLARCVFSKSEIVQHRSKAVNKEKVKGERLGVDGYNVLITIESILTKKQIVRCDDGYVRDLRAIFGKYKMSAVTPKALKILIRTIAKAEPDRVAMYFDKRVSKSGELAAEVRRLLQRAGLRGEAEATDEVDLKLRPFDVVASSDRVIIEKAKSVWDIPAEFLHRGTVNLIDLTKF